MGRGSLVVVIVVAALLSFLAGSIPIEGRSLTVVTRGETLTFTVSLSSSGYSADLSNQPVEFYAETYDIFLGIATTDENGIAEFDWLVPLDFPLGFVVINATYRGNESLALFPSCQRTDILVISTTRIIADISSSRIAPGDVITIVAVLLDDNQTPLANQVVSLVAGHNSLASATTDRNGSVCFALQCNLSWAVLGENELTLLYNGSDELGYYAPSQTTIVILVEKIHTAVELVSIPSEAFLNSTLNLELFLESESAPLPNMPVEVLIDENLVATVYSADSGNASTTIPLDSTYSIGNHTVTVSFKGNERYSASETTYHIEFVSPVAVNLETPQSVLIGEDVSVNVTVTDVFGRSVAPALVVLQCSRISLYLTGPILTDTRTVRFMFIASGPPGLHHATIEIMMNPYLSNTSLPFSLVYLYQHTLSINSTTFGFARPSQSITLLFSISNHTGPLLDETLSLFVDDEFLGNWLIGTIGHLSVTVLSPSTVGNHTFRGVLWGHDPFECNATAAYVINVQWEIPVRVEVIEYAVVPPMQVVQVLLRTWILNGTPLSSTSIQFDWIGQSVSGVSDDRGFVSLYLQVPTQPGSYQLRYAIPSTDGVASTQGVIEITLSNSEILSSQGTGFYTFLSAIVVSTTSVVATGLRRRSFIR